MPLALSIEAGHSWQIGDFWDLCGPRLLDPQTAAELGAYPKDHPEDTFWWVAVTDRSRTLLGFCAAHVGKNKVELRSDFVVPRYRRCGVYRQLAAARDIWLLGNYPGYRHEIVTRNKFQITQYGKLGYIDVNQRGSFHLLRRDRQGSLL